MMCSRDIQDFLRAVLSKLDQKRDMMRNHWFRIWEETVDGVKGASCNHQHRACMMMSFPSRLAVVRISLFIMWDDVQNSFHVSVFATAIIIITRKNLHFFVSHHTAYHGSPHHTHHHYILFDDGFTKGEDYDHNQHYFHSSLFSIHYSINCLFDRRQSV